MDVTALCPNCDEAVTLEDPEEDDTVECPECATELAVSYVDLTAVPPKMVLEEVEEDDDEDDEEEDDEFDDDEDDDETES